MASPSLSAACSRRIAARLPRASFHSFATPLQRNAGFHPAQRDVPPESPAYIDIPKPPQSEYTPKERVRGSLPVPKRIFLTKASKNELKMRPDYLQRTAPEPTSDASRLPAEEGSKMEWRRLMASQRRENLKAGLEGLYHRKRARDATQTRRSKSRFEENRKAQLAPEREDDRITRPSTGILSTAITPDPERFEKAAESAARVAAHAQKKREDRRDALMDLYVNASKFVVTEAQLRQRVDELFDADYFEKTGKNYHSSADNAFAVLGVQSNFGRMASRSAPPAGSSSGTFQRSDPGKTARRQKVVAEELTGGKLEG